MRLNHLAAFSFALLMVVGCNNVERDLVTAYAWSDDDTRHVYARSQWKFQMAVLPDGRNREEHNNARFTILAQSPDGSNRVTLVPWRGGGVNIITICAKLAMSWRGRHRPLRRQVRVHPILTMAASQSSTTLRATQRVASTWAFPHPAVISSLFRAWSPLRELPRAVLKLERNHQVHRR